MKVLVSQKIFPEAYAILEKAGLDVEVNDTTSPLSKVELTQRTARVDGLLCLLTDSIDAEVFAHAPDLKIVANVAVGYNNIDVKAAQKHRILVTNTPDVLNEATADLAFALLMAAARRIPEADRYLRTGKFIGWELFQPHLGLDVWGKTLGIVGMGRIGQAMARRAAGFNMKVVYHNRRPLEAALENSLNARYVAFGELLEASDFVSIHAPLTPETTHLFSEEAFAKMKPSSLLVNTSRGGLVNEQALAKALRAGEIRGAALDVFENEPEIHPQLLALEEHLVLVPHIGSATVNTRRRMSTLAAENIVAALTGQRPPNLVNTDTWDACRDIRR